MHGKSGGGGRQGCHMFNFTAQIGGLVMGGGIESTSHKYGLFHYVCRRLEMVTADAEVVWCSKEENCELYSAVPFR